MLEDELMQAIAGAPWRATNHVAPHEYVMADWSTAVTDLVAGMRERIRRDGYVRRFRGVPFPTVHIGEHYYWMMPRPTWPYVLNRALLTDLRSDDGEAKG